MAVARGDIVDWLKDVIDETQLGEVNEYFDGIELSAKEAADFREASEARMHEYENQVTGLQADNENLKARNYDLLMQVPATEGGTGDGAVIDRVEDDGEIIHIDNLFVDKEQPQGVM